MNDTEKDAHEVGIDKGWNHANYVAAYGPDPAPTERGIGTLGARGRMMPAWINTPTLIKAYRDGFDVGQRRFKQGRYPDGEKIPG